MKFKANLVLFALLFTLSITTQAQPSTAAESAEKLRAQLLDVQTKEEDLKARAQQLDEALKPENIERSLAGVGSTKPEELRETRRRQLQIERDGIASQLKVLETSRLHLEAAIRDADARAYQESARGPSPENALLSQSDRSTRWLLSGGIGGFVGALVGGFFLQRRLRRKS
jgi:membrane protein involved in colicin uptake